MSPDWWHSLLARPKSGLCAKSIPGLGSRRGMGWREDTVLKIVTVESGFNNPLEETYVCTCSARVAVNDAIKAATNDHHHSPRDDLIHTGDGGGETVWAYCDCCFKIHNTRSSSSSKFRAACFGAGLLFSFGIIPQPLTDRPPISTPFRTAASVLKPCE